MIFEKLDKFMPFINLDNEIMTTLLTNPRVNYMIFEKLDKFMPFINLDVIKDDRWVQTIEKAEKLLQVNEMIINKLA